MATVVRTRSLFALMAGLVLAGCSTTDTSNLTPRKLPRDANNYYHFETSWHSIRRDSAKNVHAYVMIDTELYPMKAVPYTRHRYEAFVPLPPGKTYIPYRFKFDFEYPGNLSLQRDSDLSQSYRLIVPAEMDQPIESNQTSQQ